MKNQKRNSIIVLTTYVVLFIIFLGGFIEALLSRRGGIIIIAAVALWYLGTIIKSNWTKLKPLINRLPDEDAPMDLKVDK